MMEFKAAVQKAEAKCRLISETMLLKVERKRMYEHREFAAHQAEHHVKVSCPAQGQCFTVHTPHALIAMHSMGIAASHQIQDKSII